MTDKDNGSIYSELVIEAALLKVKYIESLPDVYVEHTADFEQRLQAALRGENPYKKGGVSSRVKIALIAAIITILAVAATACAPIIRYVIQKYEDRYAVTFPDDDEVKCRDTIETVYTPSYIPDGFEIIDQNRSDKNAYTVWLKGADAITLSQEPISSDGIYGYDNDVKYSRKKIADHTVYACTEYGYCNVYWQYDGYLLSLALPETYGENVVEQIILSIE